MTSLNESVTEWIDGMKAGRDTATQQIWERYFDRLKRLAANRLGAAPRRIADEEDVVVSVFDSLCEGAAAGRFDQLEGRDDLWKLLTAIAGMKAVDQIRKQTALKRGGTQVRGDSIFVAADDAGPGFDHFVHDDPTPEFLALMDERLQVLLAALPDDSQREVAKRRFEGYTNQQIADDMGISLRSVERKLSVIRETWLAMIVDTDDSVG